MMRQRLERWGNTALVLAGICTAFEYGPRVAYAVGLWVGSH